MGTHHYASGHDRDSFVRSSTEGVTLMIQSLSVILDTSNES